MGLWTFLTGKGWTPATPVAPVAAPVGSAAVAPLLVPDVVSVAMPGQRYVEYWTATGALQRVSETPLDAADHNDAEFAKQLTGDVVPYSDGDVWDATLVPPRFRAPITPPAAAKTPPFAQKLADVLVAKGLLAVADVPPPDDA